MNMKKQQTFQKNRISPKKEVTEKPSVSPAVVARLSRYYRFLRSLKEQGVERINSAELARLMDLTASQIRQDFNCFGGFGQQGYGYNVDYLFGELRKLIGAEEGYTAAIIGVGNLGSALAHAQTFIRRGVSVEALFDASEEIIGRTLNGIQVRNIADLPGYFQNSPFDIAVLCVPKEVAQSLANTLTELGVKALWNFTGIELTVPEGCIAEEVHLGDSLLTLSYKLKNIADKTSSEK